MAVLATQLTAASLLIRSGSCARARRTWRPMISCSRSNAHLERWARSVPGGNNPPWVSLRPDDPDSVVQVRESRNVLNGDGETVLVRFEDDDNRVAVLEAWRARWEEWAANERPTRDALRVFEDLYALYARLQREGERVELVLGDGLLKWSRADMPIHHPVLLQRLSLDFLPDVPEFVIRDTDYPVGVYRPFVASMGSTASSWPPHATSSSMDHSIPWAEREHRAFSKPLRLAYHHVASSLARMTSPA